ncbi:Methylcrotonyl-CoA carboxylase biotin-containing subunit [Labilithrix luteola]|uniref:Methylcrotonyl-CoA carboxylase biotin-containing subunit n=1 Tax=Labilithrix luteola TaxID=1391654 RepID=A0A0K1Q050_9BACT|nr:biotin carboxylase N-terminal domain-containing protein [Labilithrix luteola]AKU99160.1 Methylcrotonyl-CoA carboxylase biotin-containing subunit [Labilithrix luteola]
MTASSSPSPTASAAVASQPGAAARATNHPLQIVNPGGGHVSPKQAFLVWLRHPEARLADLGTVVQGERGRRLLATRYIIANGSVWDARYVWRPAVLDLPEGKAHVAAVEALIADVGRLKEELSADPRAHHAWARAFVSADAEQRLGQQLDEADTRRFLVLLQVDEQLRTELAALVRAQAEELLRTSPAALDFLYLATTDLYAYPATTVSAKAMKYIIVADKGEMGVRAVRECIALGLTPVVCHSLQDDANALQVRLAREHGGFTVGLQGTFRETYANYAQITEKVFKAFKEKFAESWEQELALAAVYPGYGPLAENASAIRHFRQHGLVFVGPMQDVVERAGDKRTFRSMVQRLDPSAVTPGVTLEASDAAEIQARVEEAYRAGTFTFPGRLKAANGGGGRGQAVVKDLEGLPAAITKVLGEIASNGWDAGVMFEQNIPETVHLEVQVLRDRYGNTRHFGMRDCSEQRASQKIQEEAPPALLRNKPELRERVQTLAVRFAEDVGYVGAGTIELMYKEGRYYFLEMNTRIQVEHPVTEEVHAIRRGSELEPLNLVQWQMRIANGEPIDFAQDQLVVTHVGREFRINAESWKPNLKDSRDGGMGLFLPNAGTFDKIEIPEASSLVAKLKETFGGAIKDLKIRFDCGFEAGDILVNKDPTFGKLIISVAADENAYELLRQVCIAVLQQTHIEGRQVRADGVALEGMPFQTNLADHIGILEMPMMQKHMTDAAPERHVNWVVAALRNASKPG